MITVYIPIIETATIFVAIITHQSKPLEQTSSSLTALITFRTEFNQSENAEVLEMCRVELSRVRQW